MIKTEYNKLTELSPEEFSKTKSNVYKTSNIKHFFEQVKAQDTLEDLKLDLKKADIRQLAEVVEEEIRRQIEKLCFIQYAMMKTTNNWTDVGQERILYSLTRLFQKISPENPLSFEKINQTRQLIAKSIKVYESKNLSELDDEEEKLLIDLGWKKVKLSSYQLINDYLKILGSDKRMILGQLELYSSIIYGKTTIQNFADLTVYTFHDEIIHTPAIITSIAAMVKDQEIIIREVSAKTIFFNKWLETFHQLRSASLPELLASKAENVSLAIKLQTLAAYNTLTEKQLRKRKALFIKEILEGLLWHEMGHAITLNYFMTNKQLVLDEALSVLGETSSSVAKELLADMAQPVDNSRGALSFICGCSSAKAQRMLMVYLSDNWFITAGDNFFKNHTELMLSNIMGFIDEDGHFQKELLKSVLPEKYQQILKEYKIILDDFLKVLAANKYQQGSKQLSFEELFSDYRARYRRFTRYFSKKEREAYIYARIINDLKELNPAVYQGIINRLGELDKTYHNRINQGKDTTLSKLYQQMKQKKIYLKKELNISVLNDFLNKSQQTLIIESLKNNKDLNLDVISGSKDWLAIFGLIFNSLELTDSKKLSGKMFLEIWSGYLQEHLQEEFFLRDSHQIDRNILFSLIFQTVFKLAPQDLFHGN